MPQILKNNYINLYYLAEILYNTIVYKYIA